MCRPVVVDTGYTVPRTAVRGQFSAEMELKVDFVQKMGARRVSSSKLLKIGGGKGFKIGHTSSKRPRGFLCPSVP